MNLLAFFGTFALYTGWFEKFFRPAMRASEGIPEQMAVALVWLGIFFAVYLVLPILYELVKKVKAREEDVLLILLNAAVVFYYLWNILFATYRTELAFCAIGLCTAHLVMMSVVIRRCPKDVNLRLGLLAIGLFFLTIAVPLYLKMYAVAMAWGVEGVILVVIGLRYRSIWTQIGGAAAVLLSIGQLLHRLPMHTGAFRLALNPAFGTWVFVAGALLVCHIIYRRNSELKENLRRLIAQILYGATVLLLMAAVMMEWWWHCDYNLAVDAVGDKYFIRGMMIIFTVFELLLIVRPACPQGIILKVLATISAAAGSIFTMAAFTEVYGSSFVIFANIDFILALVFVAGLFIAARLRRRTVEQEEYNSTFSILFALAGIFVLWVLLTEEIYLYWYCQNRYAEKIANWRFLANMYISVMWAVYGAALMIIGFWRKVGVLRYIALGLFALLLAKVFILDTSTVKSVYRIAAFLATGVTLVGTSYLYQFSKKKGFFDVRFQGYFVGYHKFVLTDEIYNVARGDLGDIRLVGEDGEQIPYVLARPKDVTKTIRYTPSIINRSTGENLSALVTLDFGKQTVKTSIEVKTGGNNFRRAVKVEGSNDNVEFFTLVEQAYVFAIGDERDRRFNSIDLPANDYRYLRISVEPMATEKESPVINEVEALKTEKSPVERQVIELAEMEHHEEKINSSVYVYDTGYLNLPITEIKADIFDESFYRYVTVEGRDSATRKVEVYSEDNRQRFKDIEVRWKGILSNTIYRYITENGKKFEKLVLHIPPGGHVYRYLKITIKNYDDKPVIISSVSAKMIAHRIVFESDGSSEPILYVGAEDSKKPQYDLARRLSKPLEVNAGTAILGNISDNPLFGQAEAKPLAWTEKHKVLLLIVMGTMAVILGGFIFKSFKSIQSEQTRN